MPDPDPVAEPAASAPSERRASSRAATLRHALFSSFARGIEGQGTVVDISPGGMQIHTRTPVPPGNEIDLDVYPRAGALNTPLFHRRGRVAHTGKLANGEWSMGVQLLTELPESVFGTVKAMPSRAPETATALKPPSVPEVPFEEPPIVIFHRAPMPWWQEVNPWQLGILSALIMLFLLLMVRACQPLPASPLNPAQRSNAAKGVLEDEHFDRGNDLLDRGKFDEARLRFAEASRNPALPVTTRFVARLGEAEALAASGQREAARQLVAGLQAPPDVPPAWTRVAKDYAQRLQAPRTQEGPLTSLREALPLMPPPKEESAGVLPAFRIVVDKSDHTLAVLRGDQPVAVYPVGLGAAGTTPDGDFRIGNKLVNPDWNNRGQRVKAGDPANPLGSRWMGLKDGKGPTPIGIHPTGDNASIGKDISRGCIRMRPDDAERLYRLCPVGTPVHIRP